MPDDTNPDRDTRPDGDKDPVTERAREICAILDACEVPPARTLVAALHLASPAGDVIGVAVTRVDGGWAWRSRTLLSRPDGHWEAALAAARFIDGGLREDDELLDLNGDGACWVKVQRSGARLVAFGSDLLGGPLVAAEAHADPALVALLAGDALAGAVPTPAVMAVGDDVVLVEGDEHYLMLRCAARNRSEAGPMVQHPAAEPGDDDIADVADWVSGELGGIAAVVEAGSRLPGTRDVELHLRVGGWQVRVPAVVAVGAELIGLAPATAIVGAEQPPVTLPEGYELEGVLDSGELVAVHGPSGLRVALRPVEDR